MSQIKLRAAGADDAAQLLKIYAPYVTDTAISFEYVVPSENEFRARIESIMKKYPFIVAECNGELLGYTYAGEFKGRAAYDRCVETTIYVERGSRGVGVGRLLYGALETALREQNFLNLYACIATADKYDDTLTDGSLRFHEKLGYRLIGEFRKCGFKFGRWYNMVWMEKFIGEHSDEPKTVIPFGEIKNYLEF